eukprot:6753143-Ditylum_brightwellii.AAC.1
MHMCMHDMAEDSQEKCTIERKKISKGKKQKSLCGKEGQKKKDPKSKILKGQMTCMHKVLQAEGEEEDRHISAPKQKITRNWQTEEKKKYGISIKTINFLNNSFNLKRAGDCDISILYRSADMKPTNRCLSCGGMIHQWSSSRLFKAQKKSEESMSQQKKKRGRPNSINVGSADEALDLNMGAKKQGNLQQRI